MKPKANRRFLFLLGGAVALVALLLTAVWATGAFQSKPLPDLDTLIAMDDEACLKTLEDHGFQIPEAVSTEKERPYVRKTVKACLKAIRDSDHPYSTGISYAETLRLDAEVHRLLGLDFTLPSSLEE